MYKYKEHLDFPFHNHFNFLSVIAYMYAPPSWTIV